MVAAAVDEEAEVDMDVDDVIISAGPTLTAATGVVVPPVDEPPPPVPPAAVVDAGSGSGENMNWGEIP